MSVAVTVRTDWADGRTLGALQQAIEARAKMLGETSAKSVTATAINVLRSLRAETETAKKRPNIIEGRYAYEIKVSGLVGGWAHPKRSGKKGRRVVRPVGGHAMDNVDGIRVINKAGNYARAKNGTVYTLKIANMTSGCKWFPEKCDVVHVIANSEADVVKYAEERIRRRVGQYRGISKRAIGLAMHQVAGTPTESNTSAEDLSRILGRVVKCESRTNGFDGGVSSVTVVDGLPAAMLSLKNGQQSFQTAMQRAVNSTVAIINKKCTVPFAAKIETPFPEVKR